MTKRKCSMS